MYIVQCSCTNPRDKKIINVIKVINYCVHTLHCKVMRLTLTPLIKSKTQLLNVYNCTVGKVNIDRWLILDFWSHKMA